MKLLRSNQRVSTKAFRIYKPLYEVVNIKSIFRNNSDSSSDIIVSRKKACRVPNGGLNDFFFSK